MVAFRGTSGEERFPCRPFSPMKSRRPTPSRLPYRRPIPPARGMGNNHAEETLRHAAERAAGPPGKAATASLFLSFRALWDSAPGCPLWAWDFRRHELRCPMFVSAKQLDAMMKSS